jgi:hypothetical protein
MRRTIHIGQIPLDDDNLLGVFTEHPGSQQSSHPTAKHDPAPHNDLGPKSSAAPPNLPEDNGHGPSLRKVVRTFNDPQPALPHHPPTCAPQPTTPVQ